MEALCVLNPMTFLRGRLTKERNQPAVPSVIFWDGLGPYEPYFEYAAMPTVHTLFAVRI